MRLLGALLVLLPALAAAPAYQPPELLCRFKDARIQESSGLAASSRSDEFFFTHNDSGDGPFFYAVSRKGETLATWRVEGAAHLDWEDMARGPGEKGEPALYLGDIGDNLRVRPELVVYIVPEPALPEARTGMQPTVCRPSSVVRLKYEDGPRDAEALAVHPKSGNLFIVSKSPDGRCGVYTIEGKPQADRVNLLRRIAGIALADLPAGPQAAADPEGHLLSTGGDFAPDGRRLVVRTYTEAYEWTVPKDDIVEALRAPPERILLPDERGGEAIAYSCDGKALLVSTEGKHAPVRLIRSR